MYAITGLSYQAVYNDLTFSLASMISTTAFSLAPLLCSQRSGIYILRRAWSTSRCTTFCRFRLQNMIPMTAFHWLRSFAVNVSYVCDYGLAVPFVVQRFVVEACKHYIHDSVLLYPLLRSQRSLMYTTAVSVPVGVHCFVVRTFKHDIHESVPLGPLLRSRISVMYTMTSLEYQAV
jgi:hypothetical protein